MVAGPGRPEPISLQESDESAVRSGQLDAHWKKRWHRFQEYASWLAEPSLPRLSMARAAARYRASGGSRGKDFKTNSIDEIRDSLDFLLYDTIKLESRFDECLAPEGAYQLTGAGRGFVSYPLCLRDPGLFGVRNNQAERTLKILGLYPDSLKAGHWASQSIPNPGRQGETGRIQA
jgi:hypothetical protein